MIGKLRGRVDSIEEDAVILDVGGVGYHVFCSARTLTALPPVGEMAQLVIETHVREEHIHLFGFPDSVERDWFRLLTTVQRLGNRMALAILGTYSPHQIAQAIAARDIPAFSRISGIGAKLAERIVTELKDKVMKLPTAEFNKKGGAPTKQKAQNSATEDAISALVNLGYARSDAYTAAMKASQDASSLDEMIKLSLKELARA